MNQTFKNRLARLEALETALDAVRNPGPLTNADCAALLRQAAMENVTHDGFRAIRHWQVRGAAEDAAIDLALTRFNLAFMDDPRNPRTTVELVALLAQYVEDDAIPGYSWGGLETKFPDAFLPDDAAQGPLDP